MNEALGKTDPSTSAAHERPNQELVMFLERDQLTAGTSVPVARALLSRRAHAALWGLRVFVTLVSVMVIYTFAANVK